MDNCEAENTQQAPNICRPEKHIFQWHITHRCNLHCTHCYQDDRSAQMDHDDMISVLDKYERFLKIRGLEGQIDLTGGEPLLCEHFFPLAEEISRRGIGLGVMTNGMLIDDNCAARLALLRPEFVQVSLDGDARMNDSIRGKNATALALAGIDRLKKHGVWVSVSFTMQRKNRFQLDNAARICNLHDVDRLWWDRVIIPKEEDKDRISLSPAQFRTAARKAARLERLTRRPDGTSLVQCVRGLQFLYGKNDEPYTCSAGKDLLVMKADGDLMPCRRLPFIIGNIRDGELDDILNTSPVMKELCGAGVPSGCTGCRHAEKCRGGSKCVTYAKTGSWQGKDPDCPVK